ncbi:MAG: cation-translocating P-type ATPase [Sulfuricaulis sp.]|uniref:cation-translocating P-type ATPase n=1 Tax=Sulfuricaulis sp. TaxID=2003553 RepID=UPI0034A34B8F
MVTRLWHSLELNQVLKELQVDPQRGLAPEETRKRLEQYGSNELSHEEKASPLMLFFTQFKNILIVILIIATLLSALVGEYVDAAIIFVIIVFCAGLGFLQEYRAERALEALKKMLTPTITVLRGGQELEVPSKDIVPGDVLVLEAGDRIPADARLVEIHSVQCDEAPLTGESVPVGKELALYAEDSSVGDRKNMIFTGTTVTYGRGKAVVTATGMATEFGRIAQEVAAVSQEKTPLEQRTEEIGKWLGIITLVICVLVVGISVGRELWAGTFQLGSTLPIILFAIALAVAAVPEALAAIVTGALAIAMHEMAKRHALVRKMPAVETLGCTSVICTDKTGTLTKGEMTARRLYVGDRMIEASGVGYSPTGNLSGSLDDRALSLLLKGGVLASDAELVQDAERWFVKGDPTEGALVVLAMKGGVHSTEIRQKCARIEEFPFSSERKRMTTIHTMEDGQRLAFTKGAPEVLLERCASILVGDKVIPLGPEQRAKLDEVNTTMAGDALRVLGIAYKELPAGNTYTEESIETNLIFLGLVGMMDPPRDEAIDAVKVCREIHVKPVMITGDHKLTAMAVAKEIGIFRDGDLVMTGDELAKMDEAALAAVVERVTVYARVSPMDKLKIVRAWKAKGQVVAMTGDGVNDAPALKHADVGVAMGISGTDVAKEAADIVLSDDNFATIVKAIERGRWIYDNIKKYLTYLLRANMTEVVVLGGVVVVMGPEFLPLLPAAILYINLASDGLPALALGVAPADPDIMRRPPRDPKESVFSSDVRTLILLAVVIECPIFFWVFFHDLDHIDVARTEVFLMFVIIELVIALNFRSLRYSILQAPPHKWLVIAIAWELVLLAVLLQFDAVRDAFGINMPTLTDVAFVLVLAAGVMLTIEIVKAVLRRRQVAEITMDAARRRVSV